MNADYYAMHKELEAIPGIAYDLGYRPDEDGGPGRIIEYAEITMGSDRRIVFYPSKDSFEGTDNWHIFQFGPLGFRCSCGQAGIGLGNESDFDPVLSFPKDVRTVRDLIARYDELLKLMESWPKTGSVTGRDGRLHQYVISTDSAKTRKAGSGGATSKPPRRRNSDITPNEVRKTTTGGSCGW